MERTKTIIKDLLPDNRDWVLINAHQIVRAPTNELEHSIELVFAPYLDLIADYDAVKANTIVAKERHHVCVSVGYISSFILGSIWKNGTRVKQTVFVDERNDHLQLGNQYFTEIRRTATDPNSNLNILPSWIYPLFNNETYFLCIQNNNDPFNTIIPSYEILRYYYSIHNLILRAIIGGWFNLCPEKLIDKTARSKNINGIPILRTTRLVTNNKMVHCLLANFLHDDETRSNIQRTYNAIVEAYSNVKKGLIRAFPPYSGETTLRAIGRYIPAFKSPPTHRDQKPDYWRFLVHRIVDCTLKPPIDSFIVEADPDTRLGDNINNIGPGASFPNMMMVHGDEINDTPITIDREKAPSANKHPVTIELDESYYSAYNCVQIIRTEKDLRKGANLCIRIKDNTAASRTYSSGVPISDPEAPIPLNMQPVVKPHIGISKIALDDYQFELFIDSLSDLHTRLRLYDKDCELSIIPTSQSQIEIEKEIHGTKVRCSLFPAKFKGRTLEWSLIDVYNRTPRLLLVVKIRYGGSNIYAFEAQRRNTEDSVGLLLAANKDFSEMSLRLVKGIAVECARKNGTWLSKRQADIIRRQTIRHRAEDNSAKISTRIFSYIHNAIDLKVGKLAGQPTNSDLKIVSK